MDVLSIRQPHPYAMLHLGKRFENRERCDGGIPAPCRHTGPLLLHAAKGMTMREFWGAINEWRDDGRITALQHAELAPTRKTLARGGIVGWARAIGRIDPGGLFYERNTCWAASSAGDLRWWADGHALVLADIRPLPFVACPGRLGIWRVQADVLRQLERLGRRFDRFGNLLYRHDDQWVSVPE